MSISDVAKVMSDEFVKAVLEEEASDKNMINQIMDKMNQNYVLYSKGREKVLAMRQKADELASDALLLEKEIQEQYSVRQDALADMLREFKKTKDSNILDFSKMKQIENKVAV